MVPNVYQSCVRDAPRRDSGALNTSVIVPIQTVMGCLIERQFLAGRIVINRNRLARLDFSSQEHVRKRILNA